LQAEEAELQVAVMVERSGQTFQIEVGKLGIEQTDSMPCLMKPGKYSAYWVAISAWLAAKPSASCRIESSSSAR
jgi:hypothetical protein